MGLLNSDAIKNKFGRVFSAIYADGQLIRVTKERIEGGSFVNKEQPPVPIKLQKDKCSEAMRQANGYTAEDVKLLILQAGISGPVPNSDDIIIDNKGERWKIYEVYEDPANSYWGGRGVKQATE